LTPLLRSLSVRNECQPIDTTVTGPAKLCLLFWRPADAGPYADMFDLLEAEFDDLAARLDDQDVDLVRRGTTDLLDDWSDCSEPKWLQAHA